MVFGKLELELFELEEALDDGSDELMLEDELLLDSEDDVELLLDELFELRQAGSAMVRLTIASNLVVERPAAVSLNIFQPCVKSSA